MYNSSNSLHKVRRAIEADEKLEARSHYFGTTYDNKLFIHGIDTWRHDSPAFIKEFQMTLFSKLFHCNGPEGVLATGYKSALVYITQSIDKLMNGGIQITDLVISELLRQNIEIVLLFITIKHSVDSRALTIGRPEDKDISVGRPIV